MLKDGGGGERLITLAHNYFQLVNTEKAGSITINKAYITIKSIERKRNQKYL